MFEKIEKKIKRNIEIAIIKASIMDNTILDDSPKAIKIRQNKEDMLKLFTRDAMKLIKQEFIEFKKNSIQTVFLKAELKGDNPKCLVYNDKSDEYRIIKTNSNSLSDTLYFSNTNFESTMSVDFHELDSFEKYYNTIVNDDRRREVFPEEFQELFTSLLEIAKERNPNTKGFSFNYDHHIELIDWGMFSKRKAPISINLKFTDQEMNSLESQYPDIKRHYRVDLDENNQLGFQNNEQLFIDIFDGLYKRLLNNSLRDYKIESNDKDELELILKESINEEYFEKLTNSPLNSKYFPITDSINPIYASLLNIKDKVSEEFFNKVEDLVNLTPSQEIDDLLNHDSFEGFKSNLAKDFIGEKSNENILER